MVGIYKYQIIALVLLNITWQAMGVSFQTEYSTKLSPDSEYEILQKKMAYGWNTWNTKSVMSHVLLPDCFSLNLQIKDLETGLTLQNALIGRQSDGKSLIEKIEQGPRSYDGKYTDLTIEWHGIKIRVQSAASGTNLNLLITPIVADKHAILKVKPEFLWERTGYIQISGNKISAQSVNFKINIHTICTGQSALTSVSDSCQNLSLLDRVGISTDQNATIESIVQTINFARIKWETENNKHQSYADVYEPMQNVLAWNTIYEPSQNKVITLVSQKWSEMWGGFMLPVWDTYLAAYMLSFDNKELAYSNALAVTGNVTRNGFVPNITTGYGMTEDRSQPPLGSFVIKEIYKKYREKWLLYETFENLLLWNRWWDKNRNLEAYLCWGTSPYDTTHCNKALVYGMNELQGALYESGLDNSPMYDNVPFDKDKHLMLLADVGLMSLYIVDCKALAEIAIEINKPDIATELHQRATYYSNNLQKLWNNETGIFMNLRLDNHTFSNRLSPTLFYPLFAEVPTHKQAERMINEHFYNENEFFGDYILPSIARNDVAFNDNHYFRGRIWGPMNFLVYLGLRNYNIENSRTDMLEKSRNILLKTWNLTKDVYENYNATTGEGFDIGSSQKSYYWGALLGFMSLIDKGLIPDPSEPIVK